MYPVESLCRGDLKRSYLANRQKNTDKAIPGAQLLLTRTPVAEKYGPVARTFPILIRHSRLGYAEKKKSGNFRSGNKLLFGERANKGAARRVPWLVRATRESIARIARDEVEGRPKKDREVSHK